MALTLVEARARIDQILERYTNATSAAPRSILPVAVTTGKTYEAWVLCDVLERLHRIEGYDVLLVESTKVRLKSSPSEINRDFAHFVLTAPRKPPLEVWTDVEFVALSASVRGVPPQYAASCDFHELDIVVVPAGTTGRPTCQDIQIGVECKSGSYEKGMLRALLGVRRELSLLTDLRGTIFDSWPRESVPASPASCLMAYGADRRIKEFEAPGQIFGIDFVHLPLP
jgi:hypothetical protein